MILLVLGCHPLSNELVLGVDIEAQRINGWKGSHFGAAVAADEQGVLIAAPLANRIQLWTWEGQLSLEWSVSIHERAQLFWAEDGPHVWTGDTIFRLGNDGLPELIFDAVTAASYCHNQWFVSYDNAVTALRCSEEGALEKRCLSGECTIEIDGNLISLDKDGDYVWTEEGWCWGNVDASNRNDNGRVTCHDGRAFAGEGGARLGLNLSPNWAAGMMGRQLRPPRGHIVSLNQPLSLVVEGGSDALPYALSEYGEQLVVGVPTAQEQDVIGAVWLVSLLAM